jgi:superoxide dismutase, Cu-Zn family
MVSGMHRWRVAVVAATVVLTGGCGGGSPTGGSAASSAAASAAASSVDPDSTVAATASATEGPALAEGAVAPPERAADAFTYNPALVPEGADLEVYATSNGTSTTIRLEAVGLLPDRGYAAHAHANACGPTGDAAGPHFQNQPDPAAGPGKPSTDPAYANPQNEIWLDLKTDSYGDGEATATVPFVFTARAPASVIVHDAEATATEPGKAGSAGARLACLTVPFPKG